jgi:hypothetical protein
MTDDMREFAKGLRGLADWCETDEAEQLEASSSNVIVNLFAWTKESFTEKAKIFGAAKKASDENYLMLQKRFSSTVGVDLNGHHSEICERVQVGEREIPEVIVPAQNEQIIPARVEPIYEWKCPDSVLR